MRLTASHKLYEWHHDRSILSMTLPFPKPWHDIAQCNDVDMCIDPTSGEPSPPTLLQVPWTTPALPGPADTRDLRRLLLEDFGSPEWSQEPPVPRAPSPDKAGVPPPMQVPHRGAPHHPTCSTTWGWPGAEGWSIEQITEKVLKREEIWMGCVVIGQLFPCPAPVLWNYW